MVGNLQQQGVIHPFDFISGFQEVMDFGKFLILASISLSGTHLILNPLALERSNTTMSRVSFLSSAGYAGTKRSAGLIAYFDSRM
jgi:hypothetical protein